MSTARADNDKNGRIRRLHLLTPEWVGAVAVVISLIGLWIQIRDVRKSMEGQTYQGVYDQMFELHRTFFEHPKLRPYFYGGKSLVGVDDADAPQVRILAEWVCDFFDNVYRQRKTMTPETFCGWIAYMRKVYETSPALRDHVAAVPDWYPKDFVSTITSSTQPGCPTDRVSEPPSRANDRGERGSHGIGTVGTILQR